MGISIEPNNVTQGSYSRSWSRWRPIGEVMEHLHDMCWFSNDGQGLDASAAVSLATELDEKIKELQEFSQFLKNSEGFKIY